MLSFTQCGKRQSASPDSRAEPAGTPTAASPGKQELPGATPPDLSLAVPAGFPAHAHQAREFDALSEEGRQTFARLVDEFWRNESPERRGAILDELVASYYGEELLGFAAKVLELTDEGLRLRAIEMLSGNTSAAIIPVLEKVLTDPSEAVRLEAVAAVAQVRDDAVVSFLGKAFEDASEAVRAAGFGLLEDQTEARKLKVLGRALQAAHADVQTAAIDALQLESTAQSVEVLFGGLDSADPQVRREAQFSIDFLIDHEFASSTEARAWWKENKGKFEQDLTPKE